MLYIAFLSYYLHVITCKKEYYFRKILEYYFVVYSTKLPIFVWWVISVSACVSIVVMRGQIDSYYTMLMRIPTEQTNINNEPTRIETWRDFYILQEVKVGLIGSSNSKTLILILL